MATAYWWDSIPTDTVSPIFWVLQDYVDAALLAKYLGPDQPLYAMRSCDGIVKVKDYTADVLETVCNRYLWEMLALPKGPAFILGGTCQGGILALAMARRLKQIGRTPLYWHCWNGAIPTAAIPSRLC